MRIVIIGANGTIGKEIVKALSADEVRGVGRGGEQATDIREVGSIWSLYARVGTVDAIVCAAGSGAWKPLADLSDEDFALSLNDKLMGQVNVIRYGFAALADSGSITVTS